MCIQHVRGLTSCESIQSTISYFPRDRLVRCADRSRPAETMIKTASTKNSHPLAMPAGGSTMNTLLILVASKAIFHLDPFHAMFFVTFAALSIAALALHLAILLIQLRDADR